MIEHMVHEERARKEFSQRLALACDKAGLIPHGRQAEIAKRMKLTPKAVSKWFNGESIPRRGTLKALASHIGTSASYLLGDVDEDGIDTEATQTLKDVFRIDLLDITVSPGLSIRSSWRFSTPLNMRQRKPGTCSMGVRLRTSGSSTSGVTACPARLSRVICCSSTSALRASTATGYTRSCTTTLLT